MMFWHRRHRSLSSELDDYLARETAENLARGLSPSDARAAAQRKLGNTTRIKEDTSAAWGFLWLERLWQDVDHGARMFVKNPGFAVVAILSIALGTGANVAMFSAADALLLRPLPVAEPSEVVSVGARFQREQFTEVTMSYPDFADVRERTQSFRGLAGYSGFDAAFASEPDALPKLKAGLLVSANLFPLMGISPLLGRTFRADEDLVPERDHVVMLSYDFWQSEFDADPAVLGRTLRINGSDYAVIGVTPAGFTGMSAFTRPVFYVPLMMWPSINTYPGQRQLEDRGLRFLSVKGRLKPDVSIEEARAELSRIAADLERAYPETNGGVELEIHTEIETRALNFPPNAQMSALALTLSMAILLVACANLAGLLLSRSPVRAREIALRLAVGAPKIRLLRQLITENLMLAVCGGVLGLGAGAGIIRLLQQVEYPGDLPFKIDFQFDGRALAYSMAAAVLSVFVFGLAPAFQTLRADVAGAIKNAGAMAGGRGRLWGRNLLVTLQVAVALVLLAMSIVVYRGFDREFGSGPGYRIDRLLMMSFDPALVDQDVATAERFYDELLERTRALPGVRSAALSSVVPMNYGHWQFVPLLPENFRPLAGDETESLRTHFAATVDDSYFRTMAMPIVRGRGFEKTDAPDAPPVAVVNQTFADRYWPGQNPVGKRFRVRTSDGPWVKIVGLTPTSKYLWPGEGPTPFLYFPRSQNPSVRMTLMVETAGDPAELTAPVRDTVRRIDPHQPMYDVRTMREFYDLRAISAGRLSLQIIGGMGISGMLLSMVGLYGLVEYSARRRTREIGIRIAVGAEPASVLRMILGHGLWLAGAGVAVGLVAARATVRLFEASYPWTTAAGFGEYAGMALAAVLITSIAAFIPARRASRVDPTVALRND